MSPELEKKLFETYPKFFAQKDLDMRQTCMCWGIECGDGWYSIIDEFCKIMLMLASRYTHGEDVPANERTFEFTQIKEKYGTLRLYWTTNSQTYSDFACILEAIAEWKSEQVCEECGEPGVLNTEGWYQVRCKKCLTL